MSGRDGEEMRPDGLGSQRGVQGEDAQARGWGPREAARMRERVKASALRRERGTRTSSPCLGRANLTPSYYLNTKPPVFPGGKGRHSQLRA